MVSIIVERPTEVNIAQYRNKDTNRTVQRATLIDILQKDEKRQANDLLQFLENNRRIAEVQNLRSFWIAPVITLDASPAIINQLAQREDVLQIRFETTYRISPFQPTDTRSIKNSETTLWNLEQINQPLTVKTFGLDGTGITVANLDTGVDWNHSALQKQYRGYRENGLSTHIGNWHVATNETYLYPGDGYGHGTHTMGTMVGMTPEGQQIGVAPNAKWIAVKLFTDAGITRESWIHDAFQWILAPNGNPDLAPDVVNNSWGNPNGSLDSFRQDIEVLRAAGIVPVFSAGNDGPNINTVGSPGSYPESIAVGALDSDAQIASFSSRGGSVWDEIKPEISAPGVNIYSTLPGGGYGYSNGTSMAAPHVAGIAALLRQADSNLTVDEIEEILTQTATPLSNLFPNNVTGWGLVNAYQAAQEASETGIVSGTLIGERGLDIHSAFLNIKHMDTHNIFTRSVASNGEFAIGLLPGVYEIRGGGFGYQRSAWKRVQIQLDNISPLTIQIERAPFGILSGKITRSTMNPVKILVEGTPIITHVSSEKDQYQLELPTGQWVIRAESQAHFIEYFTATIQAKTDNIQDLVLHPAPTLMLVDGGSRYYDSSASYFRSALDALAYTYTNWVILPPTSTQTILNTPTITELVSHDVIVWSAPLDSPAIVGAGKIISDFLGTGGKLILSGQDIAYWDAGGYTFIYSPYFSRFLDSYFWNEDTTLTTTTALNGTPLEGLEIQLNTPDSKQQQFHPDIVELRPSQRTFPLFPEINGRTMGLYAGGCEPYRAAWTGFGLEGIGPSQIRQTVMQRLIDWTQQPPASYAVAASEITPHIIGQTGEIYTETFALYNTGVQTDTYLVRYDTAWNAQLAHSGKIPIPSDSTLLMAPCSEQTITMTVQIPNSLERNITRTNRITFTSQMSPSIFTAQSFTMKSQAGILFVQDSRFRTFTAKYQDVMDQIGLDYDTLDTDSGRILPTQAFLNQYDYVVWSTGDDWFEPLNVRETELISSYLQQGGRFLLTSQDTLDYFGETAFGQETLGIKPDAYTISSTKVFGAETDLIFQDFMLSDLSYPFNNYSDALQPTTRTVPILHDSQLNVVGVGGRDHPNRGAHLFYAFPLETLPNNARADLLAKSLLWLSPLNASYLDVPTHVHVGEIFTLSLELQTLETLSNAEVALPLPPGFSVDVDKMTGGWGFDSINQTLFWQGDLLSGINQTLTAVITTPNSVNQTFEFNAKIATQQDTAFTLKESTIVQGANLTMDISISPPSYQRGSTVTYTAHVENTGTHTANLVITNTIPRLLEIDLNTITTTRGIPNWIAPKDVTLYWPVNIPPGQAATLQYNIQIGSAWSGIQYINFFDIKDKNSRKGFWHVIQINDQHYLPIILNQTNESR